MKAFSLLLALAFTAVAQVVVFTKDDLIRFTKENPFERSADGRPRVPDHLLKKVEGLSIEEAWEFESVRWETGRWAAALAAGLGVMLMIAPNRRV